MLVERDELTYRPPRRWRFVVASVLVVAFLVADQLTKVAARAALAGGADVTVIPGVLSFTYVENTGVSFGLAAGFGPLFSLLALVVVIGCAAYLWRAPLLSRLEVVGLGMLAGGALGNAIDRVAFGFVTDFIATDFIDFPVFNVADIGVTVGVALALIGFALFSPANADAKRRAKEDRSERLAAREQAGKPLRNKGSRGNGGR